jgi:hypothetical protein
MTDLRPDASGDRGDVADADARDRARWQRNKWTIAVDLGLDIHFAYDLLGWGVSAGGRGGARRGKFGRPSSITAPGQGG